MDQRTENFGTLKKTLHGICRKNGNPLVMNSGNIIIQLPCLRINVTPLGFHRYASEFLRSADSFKANSGYSPVPYYLYCRSIELSLKAFLLTAGYKKTYLKNTIKHNLENALREAEKVGLRNFLVLGRVQRGELVRANGHYLKKGFEYFEINHLPGFRKLPRLEILSVVAKELVNKLQQPCLNAA